MSSRKSVLILCPFFRPNVGGVETHLDDLCEYLRKNHKVYVIAYQPLTTKAKGARFEGNDNLEIHRVGWFGHNWFHKLECYPLLEFLYLAPGLLVYSLFWLLRNRKRVDVIHAHGLVAAAIGVFLSRVFRKRIIVSLHTIYRFREKLKLAVFARKTFSYVDRLLAISNSCREDLVSVGIPASKITVYTSWVNQSIFKPMDKERCKEKLGFKGKFIVLFVGRFIKAKGIDVVLEAASIVKDDIKFVLIGEGPLENVVRQQAGELSNIILADRVDDKDLPLYYNASDVLVWGSVDADYLGRVTIGALSCGLPVIIPNRVEILGVTKEVQPTALDPSVVIPIEPEARLLNRKLSYFYHNPGELASLRDRCRDFALSHYSDKNAGIIEASYDM